MALKHVTPDTPIDTIMAIFDTDGGLIVDGMIPRDVIDRMREDALAFARGCVPGAATQGIGKDGKEFVGANTVRFSSLGRVSPAFFAIVENPVYAAMADRVLGANGSSYWINTGQAMLIGPGEKAQMLHRDCLNWFPYCAALWPDCAEVTISAMIALDDVTEELGATRVIPGSHRWADLADNGSPEQTVPAAMTAGSALVYSGKLVHGGGANRTTDRWRLAMHLSFVAGWLTPEEATALDYDVETVRGFSPRLQRLLGYRSFDPRPTPGGGLWLRHVDTIENVVGY